MIPLACKTELPNLYRKVSAQEAMHGPHPLLYWHIVHHTVLYLVAQLHNQEDQTKRQRLYLQLQAKETTTFIRLSVSYDEKTTSLTSDYNRALIQNILSSEIHHLPSANVLPYSDPRQFKRASIATPKPRPPIKTPSTPCPAAVVLSHEVVGLSVSSVDAIRSLQVSTCDNVNKNLINKKYRYSELGTQEIVTKQLNHFIRNILHKRKDKSNFNHWPRTGAKNCNRGMTSSSSIGKLPSVSGGMKTFLTTGIGP